MTLTGEPRNKREAKQWVREHWQAFMRSSDIPDPSETMSEKAQDLIDDVWSEQSKRLADKLDR